MAHIVCWEKGFGARTLVEHALRNPSSVGDRTPPTATVVSGEIVQAVARVSGGFWIVDCPTDGCSGAELVNFAVPLFFCCECRNAAFDHALLEVVIPAPTKRGGIESYLVARPVPATRNWLPDETVTYLRDDNRAHGIKLLPKEEDA